MAKGVPPIFPAIAGTQLAFLKRANWDESG